MVDPGEQVSLTLQREFSEEALNSLTVPPSDREKIYERITKLFSSNGSQVSHLYTHLIILSYILCGSKSGGKKYFETPVLIYLFTYLLNLNEKFSFLEFLCSVISDVKVSSSTERELHRYQSNMEVVV